MGKLTKNGHELWTPDECRCGKEDCPVCEHGLAICKKCNRAECELDEPCEPRQSLKRPKVKQYVDIIKQECELDEPCEPREAANVPKRPEWIERAAKRIRDDVDDSRYGLTLKQYADIIEQEWDAFVDGCERHEEPPLIPINPLEERIHALEMQMITLQGERINQQPSLKRNKLACSFGSGSLLDDGKTACSYHTHYLKNYDASRCGEKLDHGAFHTAECCNEAVQQQITDWLKAHPNEPLPDHLKRKATYWENRCAY